MSNTATLNELAARLAEKAGIAPRMSEIFIKETFAVIANALLAGDKAAIKALGVFETQSDGQSVLFTPDSELEKAVNAPFEAFVPVTLHESVTDEVLKEIDRQFEQSGENAPEADGGEPDAGSAKEDNEVEDDTETAVAEDLSVSKAESREPEKIPVSPSAEEPSGISEAAEPAEAVAASIAGASGDIDIIKKRSMLKGLGIGLATAVAVAGIAFAWHAITNKPNPATQQQTAAKTEQQKPAGQQAVTEISSVTNCLTLLAQKHYGRQEFWVYILLENKDKIEDYRNVPNGIELTIPPREKYGIDPDNKESLHKANVLAFEEYKKLQTKPINKISN